MSQRTHSGPAQVEANALRAGAVVVAGPSTRKGGMDTIWAPVAGQPLVAWAIQAFEAAEEITEVVAVVAPERVAEAQALAQHRHWRKVRAVVADGPRRCDSVREGLRALSAACEWVVIHDGARPLVTLEMIASGLEAARNSGAAAAYEPVKETIKRVRDGIVVETPERAELALLQTPQVFRRELLEGSAAECAPESDPADEATLLLRRGIRVAVFPGGHDNVRVTGPDDLEIVEALLKQRHT